ncbi:MAG: glycoside hydrolase family 44 protein [Armatimonadetes bacterium]|nr:glycoside hydrolase family 44 protein [Armatimonadota bacterium]
MSTTNVLLSRLASRRRWFALAGVAFIGLSAACLSGGTAPGTAKAQAPTTAEITVTVDAAKSRRAIDPRIYGSAYADDAAIKDLRLPVHRLGGNNTSRYNWKQNADNRGNDWFFQSIGDDSATPGERIDTFITRSKTGGAEPMITVPIIGHVAKIGANREKTWSYSVQKYGAQEKTDQYNTDSGNGKKADGKEVSGNNPLDANIAVDAAYQKPWIEAIKTKHGAASGKGLRYYVLDNEPGIWHGTHRDVHPTGAKMDEVRDKSVATAQMLKSVDPAALVMGPEEWGWTGYLYSGYDSQWGNTRGWAMLPDKLSHGNKEFSAWYLEAMKAAEMKTGKRLLDIFTLHIYPQGGEFSGDVSEAMQLRRNRSTRALFDPAYKDETWINDTVRLIPRMKEWVANNYPGTQTGITEYNWGAEESVNGATAQADIYGIFGREGLDMGARWTTPKTGSPVYNAMKLFRNYDNKASGFGETSVSATTNAPYETLTTYASERKDGAITVLIVNKGVVEKPETRQVSLSVTGKASGAAQVWQIGTANSGAITPKGDVSIKGGKVALSLPTPSVTLLVIPKN